MNATRTAPLVTVVTPVYNGAKYIRECIESVLSQTYSDWEYLVVDNRSTDGTAEIAREYEAHDRRVGVVVPDDFVPALANANRSLRLVPPEAKYVKVLHGDDFLHPECLAKMVEVAEVHPSAGIVGAYRVEGDRGVSLKGIPTDVTCVQGRSLSRSMLLSRVPYVFGSPTSVLLRADLVRERPDFYNVDTPFQADQEACYELLQKSDFGFVHETLTYTRRHEEAGMPFYVRVGAQIPGQIDLLIRFGPIFLGRREFQMRLATRLVEYGLLLASRVRDLRDPDFRRYHGEFLRFLERNVSLGDVSRGVAHRVASVGRSTPGNRLQPCARTP